MSLESDFFGPPELDQVAKNKKIEAMLLAASQPVGHPLVPDGHRCACRPAMVQASNGEARIYLEVVMTPEHVHRIMGSVPELQKECELLVRDVSQVLYEYVMRTRGSYFEGRKGT